MGAEEYTVTGYLTPDSKGLVLDNADRLVRIIRHLKDIPLEITFKKFYRKRSLAQNRWIWGVCVPAVIRWIKETQGETHDKETIYAYLRIRVIGQTVTIKRVMGVDIITTDGKRFSAMTTIEFSEAVEQIVQYYAERGMAIPLPQPKTNNLITDFLHDD